MVALAIMPILCGLVQGPGAGQARAERSGLAKVTASTIDRRCLIAGAAPLLALYPLASLAKTEKYLPPGQETEEFKTFDARATAFKRAQLQYKQTWQKLTDQLLSATNDAEAIEAFAALKKAFLENGERNLPEGLSRDAFLRQVRRKQREMEAKGMWEKPVRMEFLELKTGIDSSLKPKSASDGPVMG